MNNELQLVENELVPVYETSTGEKVVNGRELWTVLKSKSDFSTWVKFRLEECDATENIDFTRFHKKMEANNATMIEYIIKLDTAKEMAMLERNEIGKQVRRYFIKIEKKYKEQLVQSTQSSAPVFEDYIHKTFKFKSQDVEVLKIDDQLLFNMFHIGRCLEMRDEIIKSFAQAIGKEQLIRFKLDEVYNYKLHNYPIKNIDYCCDSL